jgi:hypothetical protein
MHKIISHIRHVLSDVHQADQRLFESRTGVARNAGGQRPLNVRPF